MFDNNPLLAALFQSSAIRPGDLTPNTNTPTPVDDGGDIAVTGGFPPVTHRGMFGLHGTTRDILGVLGDAFLAQAKQPAVYGPKRHQEREADALRGFANDPLAAIGRYTKEDPEGGLDAYNKFDTQSRLSRAADEDYTGKVVDRATRLLGAATPENYPAIRDQVKRYASVRGVTLPFDLPDVYDEKAIAAARQSGVPTNQQIDDSAIAAYRGKQQEITETRIGALEAYRDGVLSERRQYHQGVLGLGRGRLDETTRHDRTNEDLGSGRLGETRLHNRATEGLAETRETDLQRYRDGLKRQRERELNQYTTGARGNVRRPDPSNFRHKIVNGQIVIQRLVNGEWKSVE